MMDSFFSIGISSVKIRKQKTIYSDIQENLNFLGQHSKGRFVCKLRNHKTDKDRIELEDLQRM